METKGSQRSDLASRIKGTFHLFFRITNTAIRMMKHFGCKPLYHRERKTMWIFSVAFLLTQALLYTFLFTSDSRNLNSWLTCPSFADFRRATQHPALDLDKPHAIPASNTFHDPDVPPDHFLLRLHRPFCREQRTRGRALPRPRIRGPSPPHPGPATFITHHPRPLLSPQNSRRPCSWPLV
ncbi:hypothetical protein IWX90DRAFT_279378 [Phyllosticta citrichinensis]|uniref:Uncharacterized protein n=1 Tax=Phyllosticta citrichinensis TaxID=1130410 RepID=A0ABR1XNN5_9PEZI